MSLTEQAVNNHKHFYSCSASVLCAFCEEAGITANKAKSIAWPFAGGCMGKCGAVLAAEYVLKNKYGEDAEEKISEFETKFRQMNQSVICRELKGLDGGQMLRSCRGCVNDAAEILENMIA